MSKRTVGIVLVVVVLVVVGKRYSGKPAAAETVAAPALVADPPDVAEPKARELTKQFLETMVKRDVDAVLAMVDVPWVGDYDYYKDASTSEARFIHDRKELDRVMARFVLTHGGGTKKPGQEFKPTHVRRWEHVNAAMSRKKSAEAKKEEQDTAAIASVGGWLVVVELSEHGEVYEKPIFLVVVVNGKATIRGVFVQQNAAMEKLIAR